MEQEFVNKSIGTHNGVFHADEVLACAMLSKFTQEFKDAKIVRTRDQSILDKMDLVVDVGGVYEPEKKRYDHHQRTFKGTLNERYRTTLSGAGLIYKHYGQEIVLNVMKKVLNETKTSIQIDPNDSEIQALMYKRVYDNFIESVDGQDNGINQYNVKDAPNYKETTGYGARISRLNPMWSEEGVEESTQFNLAMEIASQELFYQVKQALLNWYPGRPFVLQSLKNRNLVHPSGQILKLEKSLPWKDHLYQLEKELGIANLIKFVLFPEAGNRAWRVQAINIKDSFDLRVGLKKEWRGIKEMDLLKSTSNISDIVFVHMSGFIGGAISYESALRMAVESIEAEEKKDQQ